MTNAVLEAGRKPGKPRDLGLTEIAGKESAPREIGARAPPSDDDDAIAALLGGYAFIRVKEACKVLRISSPTLYRAMRRSLVKYVWQGGRRAITRAEMQRLLREGVGRLSEKDI